MTDPKLEQQARELLAEEYEAVMARRPIPPSRPNKDATHAPEFSKRRGREL